ncbi:MAG: hypothetical protein LBU89_14620 [Fibromonadaceae bacterium]|jgi:hypothetical protein|nr:hypothetical protein [Fibromonadaceae bacterium]
MKIKKYAYFAFFSLLFACGEHDIVEREATYEELPFGSSQQESSSSYQAQNSSSSSIFTSSSSSFSFSSDSGSDLSSSSEPDVDVCDFSVHARIDAECFYEEKVRTAMGRTITLGSQARLEFADKASLEIYGSSLKIEAGAELSFGEGSEFLVDAEGSLEISGEEEKPVVLKATDDKNWAGLRVRADSRVTNIEYADLSGALTGINFGKDGVLKNSKVHNNIEYGLRQNTSFSEGNFSGNEFFSNGYDARVSLTIATTLGSSEQFGGKLHIFGNQSVSGNITLPDFVYDIDGGVVTVAGALEIMPGAHFYFAEFSSISVTSGGLKVVGTADKPIVFESVSEVFWGRPGNPGAAFFFTSNCVTENIFEHFKVLQAKTAFYNDGQCKVTLSNGEITYRDKDFDKSTAIATPDFDVGESVDSQKAQ